MKHIIILIATVFIAGTLSVNAQEEKPSKKEQKKMEKKAEAERKYVQTENLLDSMNFVLEAYYLGNQRGSRIIVPSTLNFIKVDSSEVVLQVGRNSGVGYNGVGGTTAEGTISKYEVTKNKKKGTFDLTMNVLTNIGSYDIFMIISSDGRATATISGIYPGKLTYEGDLVSIAESRVYKGRTLY